MAAAYEQADGTTTQYTLWQLNTYYNQPFGHPDIKKPGFGNLSGKPSTAKATHPEGRHGQPHLIYGPKRQLLPNAVPALHFVSQGV
ncbi:MAG: hypothetical protein R2857_00235 [Vampirovibrionales bacterium]